MAPTIQPTLMLLPMIRKALPRAGLLDVLGLIFLLTFLFLVGNLAGDPGIGWHLKAGEITLSTKSVPRTDPFLSSSAGGAWISDQWLSDLIFYKCFELGSWALLHVVAISISVASFFIVLAPLASRIARNRLILLATFTLVVSAGSIQWFLRPVVFSFLLFAVLYRQLLESALRRAQPLGFYHERSLYYTLPLLFVLWANLHGGFVLGLATVVLFTMLSPVNLRVFCADLVLIACCFLATLINPYGPELYQNILGLSGSEFFMNLNKEWLSADLHTITFRAFFGLLLLLLLLVSRKTERTFNRFEIGTLLFFALLALLQRRSIPYFAIVSVVVLVKLFEQVKCFGNQRGKIGEALSAIEQKDMKASTYRYTATAMVLALMWTLGGGTLRETSSGFREGFPLSALEQLSTRPPGPIFHTPDFGGVITWKLWPKFKAFIDDRNQVVSQSLYEEFFTLDKAKPGWREVLEKHQFRYALLRPDSPLRLLLEMQAGWKLLFRDENSLLFVRI